MPKKAPSADQPVSVRRRRLRRRLSGALLLAIGLGVAGGLAATLTPAPQVAVADESASAMLRTGQQLYETSCVTCHGINLQGVADRGPSLIGVGEAAVYFQVSTGRMPLELVHLTAYFQEWATPSAFQTSSYQSVIRNSTI